MATEAITAEGRADVFTFDELRQISPEVAQNVQNIIFSANQPRGQDEWITKEEHRKNSANITELLASIGIGLDEVLTPEQPQTVNLPTLSTGKITLGEWISKLSESINLATYHDAVWSGRR